MASLDNTRIVFEDRRDEINSYFEFLDLVFDRKASLQLAIPHDAPEDALPEIREISDTLRHTLLANAFLLLYNIIEATMRTAFDEIYVEFKSVGVSIDQLNLDLQKYLLDQYKKKGMSNIHGQNIPISQAIVHAGFSKKKLFEGNIQHSVIAELARQYGFSINTDYSKTRHGERLQNVKNRRNQLAHGEKSFVEIGQTDAIDTVMEMRNEVLHYLDGMIENIESYLVNKGYLGA